MPINTLGEEHVKWSVSGLGHEHWHIHNLDLHIEALPQKSLLVQDTGSDNFGFTQCQLGDLPHWLIQQRIMGWIQFTDKNSYPVDLVSQLSFPKCIVATLPSHFKSDRESLLTSQTLVHPVLGSCIMQMRRTSNQQWVLIAQSTKVMSASYYSCLPLAQSIFLRKRWMMPRHKFGSCHQFGCVIDTRRHVTCITYPSVYYTPKVCIIKPKFCVWAAPRRAWRWWDTSWWGNWAVREKNCTV
jgi:hypothetical protein